MASSHIRDILTAFSPTMDLFAISLGDGRIKIWDTVKGQVQTEFTDISSADTTTSGIFGKQEGGHLSMDYTCMKWLSLWNKKKRKLGSSVLVLGTGSGDVLALDVSSGQLKWRVDNCHAGGVTSISFPRNGSHIYTAGVDGVVCEIDTMSGNTLNKFSAASNAISCIAASPDGNMIATAAGRLKILNCSNQKRLQKFSGHPGPVRCMTFSEDGKYILSSASGERYIAVWKVDGSKRKTATVSLAMDHPAIFLDSKSINNGDAEEAGLSILSISEMGIAYFWYGKTIDDLHNSKPTKVFVPSDDGLLQKHKGMAPNVFDAKLQSVSEPGCGHLFLSYGLIIKPTFDKVLVHSGSEVKLTVSLDGILLPVSQSQKSKKASDVNRQVTALDRSNADGALPPVAKIYDLPEVKKGTMPAENKDQNKLDTVIICVEDRLRYLGVLGDKKDAHSDSLGSKVLKGINLDESTPLKKIKSTISSLEPAEALSLLKTLLDVWQSRSHPGKHVIPWIYSVLIYHGDYIKSKAPKLIDFLCKVTTSNGSAMDSLLQLSGRLQLVSTQIDKSSNNKITVVQQQNEEEEDESDEDEVDEAVYGKDEDFETDTDTDD